MTRPAYFLRAALIVIGLAIVGVSVAITQTLVDPSSQSTQPDVLILAQAQPMPQPRPAQQQAQPQRPPQQQPQPQQPQPQPQYELVDRNGAMILMRMSMIALHQANRLNDYSVFRALGSASLQANSAARLSEIFAGQRNYGLNLAYTATMEPRWIIEPRLESATGVIRMAGVFEVTPTPVQFDMTFERQNNQWLLSTSGVTITQPETVAKQEPVSPAAPPPAPAPAPPPKPAAPPPKPTR